jgi:16S rRNA (cytosine967-C5)-methyltransferase
MRLHRSTTEAVIQSLEQIFNEGRYADKVIEKVLKQNPKWGARDRRFIAETTYDIVRWYLLLRFVIRAKEDDYWKLLAAWCILHRVDFPDWDEFKGINRADVTKRYEEAKEVRKVRESVPDWMDDLGETELGDRWEQELVALNDEAPVVLRANTLKISRKDLASRLSEENIETNFLEEFPEALVLRERQNIFGVPAFKEGLFEVQDAASQAIAPFLEAEPGMRVIDACAGAGGKTLHLAARMKNKGKIIAMDVEQWKLDELMKRARRAGVTNLEPRLIDSSKVIKRLESSADRLLLDVPCSGIGVLKRNPDAKWKLSDGFINEVMELQQHILNDYCSMVKPGGLLVYSTCSILPSENEKQVQKFLEGRKDQFTLLKDAHLWPTDGFDGFYMALLRRDA